MIRNLNQLSFQRFGTITPERRQNSRQQEKAGSRMNIKLTQGDIPVYKSQSETWLCCGTGMTVLSVSSDGAEYEHFYLDKPVCIHAGIWFSLAPFRNESTAELTATVLPVQTGLRDQDPGLLMKHRMQIGNIYTIFYQEKEQGFLFPGESHPMPELTYVDQGSLHSVADGQDLMLEQGDMVLYGPDQWHMQYADIEVAPRFVTISFDVDGCDLTPLLNRKFRAPQRVMGLLQQLLREQERSDVYSTDMIICLLQQLLLTLLREASSPSAGKLRAVNAVHSENEIIRRAQQYITLHIREKMSVPAVARKVDVSPSYLTALFHKNLQISPGEYIRRIKLQESKQMIREDNMNFTEIAAVLQYSSVHHFSRQFKEKFGITPSEYAKSVR